MQAYTALAMKGEHERARTVRDSLEPVRKALRPTRPSGKPQAHQKYWQELLGQNAPAATVPRQGAFPNPTTEWRQHLVPRWGHGTTATLQPRKRSH